MNGKTQLDTFAAFNKKGRTGRVKQGRR